MHDNYFILIVEQLEKETDYSQITIVLVAAIGGFIALLQIRNNVILTSRMKWIESLRETVCSYDSELENLLSILINSPHKAKGYKPKKKIKKITKDYELNYAPSFIRLNTLGKKICLSLNDREDDHIKVQKHIKNINEFLKNKITDNIKNEIKKELDEINLSTKKILSYEWKKTKRFLQK